MIPLNRVAPLWSAVEKSSTTGHGLGSQGGCQTCSVVLFGAWKSSRAIFCLKQLRCPECGAAETLNCHSKLFGNDPNSPDRQGRVQRGQRVWCSNRGQRGGCGRSFCIFLAQVLPRHTLSGPQVWRLLKGLLSGGSIKAAVEALRLPFALESVYHLLHRLKARLPQVRSLLCREQKAPASSQTDPLLQTVEHLRKVFPRGACPPSDFQLHFQRPLLE